MSYYQRHKNKILAYGKRYRLQHKEILKQNQLSRRQKPRYKFIVASTSAETNRLLKIQVLMFYSNPPGYCICNNCGEQNIDVLCIDHIDNNGGEHRKSLGSQARDFYRWLKNNNFPDGYQVLCWNCNREKFLAVKTSKLTKEV